MGFSLDFNQLASMLNQNIKTQKPDGTTEFFDDSDMLSAAFAGQTPAQAVPGMSPAGVPPQIPTFAPGTPASPEQAGGGFNLGEFLKTPGAIQMFGELAQAFTTGQPNNPFGQIGKLAGDRAQSQIFKQLLEDLTNQAVGGGSPSNPPSALGVL